jgi:hypothetical protein
MTQTQWQYIPDQHCYSALRGQFGLRVQKRNGVWQWFAERLELEGGCEIIAGSSDTRAAALLAAINAADRSEDK